MEICDFSYLDKNLADIQKRMAEAQKRTEKGNSAELLVASKYASAEEMNYLASKGVTKFGENRVSSLLEKYDKLDKSIELHFIGSLQTNKVKSLIGKVSLIHSLDSLRLAEAIEKHSAAAGVVTDVLCEINIGREEQKGGILPECAEEFILSLSRLENLRVCGLMTMGPVVDDPEGMRPYFRQTKELYDVLNRKSLFEGGILSMGMSDSYVVAIEEGATLVRVGRKLFNRN